MAYAQFYSLWHNLSEKNLETSQISRNRVLTESAVVCLHSVVLCGCNKNEGGLCILM